jgi:cell wall-associated NlpC family hydrolase
MPRARLLLLALAACLWTAACASNNGPMAPRSYPGEPQPAPAEPAVPPSRRPAQPPTDQPALPPAPSSGAGNTAAAPVPPASIPSPTIDGAAIAAAALAERGRPYRLGGETPAGFDCSGLVQYVFAQQGIAVPRQVIDQFTVGHAVPRREIQAGDLLFFATTSDEASHVGIALDRDRFVDAPSAHGHVRIDRLSAPYWKKRFLGARRIEASAATREAPPQ